MVLLFMYELGRQPTNKELSSNTTVRRIRVRGGNVKWRTLRLDTRNYSWGSEAVTRKTKILDVVYNASNNELHYNIDIDHKKKAASGKKETEAKPIIESGDVKGILDPKLNGNINETQMNRMVQAATLCITRSARLRPKMSQILELLKGKKAVEKWGETENENTESQEHHTDDEFYPNSRPELHLSVAMLEVADDSTSFCSMEQGGNFSTEEYLKERWSRSSSFD
ncbi:hypothetical protein V6N12_002910 [Hibiscus sabdariffa]|uniref:Uncharacterized protein n=1 Tax=Hibiscus sabdariffa TaxID=183260 RepID=A0ABR2EC58_9ROSI